MGLFLVYSDDAKYLAKVGKCLPALM